MKFIIKTVLFILRIILFISLFSSIINSITFIYQSKQNYYLFSSYVVGGIFCIILLFLISKKRSYLAKFYKKEHVKALIKDEEGEKIDIPCRCSMCKAMSIVRVNLQDYAQQQVNRIAVQDRYSYLDKEEREILISGYCRTCQRKLFAANYN